MAADRQAIGPGRVNLIGDHTDYNDGLALPVAIDLGVAARLTSTGAASLTVTSDAFPEPATLPIGDALAGLGVEEMRALRPSWARAVAAVARRIGVPSGGSLALTSTLPVGAGLSSSAALSVAVASVLGADGEAIDLARLCQAAEHDLGVPVGLLDPLVCASGRRGHALLIDFATLDTRLVKLPQDLAIVVVDSGERRALTTSAYAARVRECRAAARLVGPLGQARPEDLASIHDTVLARRARHVVSECARVRECATALEAGDLSGAGQLMVDSHWSLARDFEVSTPTLDALVGRLAAIGGVYGARMTGAGFGGCVVALAEPGAVDPGSLSTSAWEVSAADGALVGSRG